MSISSLLPDKWANYVRNTISNRSDENMSKELSAISEQSSLAPSETSKKIFIPTEQTPVGILGAGASGLYTALILDSLDIPYKILEARGDVGGRLFTHHFPNPTGAPYNYFDVGAMRFPKVKATRRLFNLFELPPLNAGDIQLKAKLIPFYQTNGNAFFSYNGVTVRQNAVPSGDPFKAAQVIQDTDPDPYISAGAKAIEDDVVAPFITRLMDDMKSPGKMVGWEYLMKHDKYSTRAYMALAYTPSDSLNIPKEPLPTDVINWCETQNTWTGWYDCAFSEYVLSVFSEGWEPGPEPSVVQWFCIDGGSNEIAQCMARYIHQRKHGVIHLNSKVTSIGLSNDGCLVDVVTNGTDLHRFSHAICTIPLTVLRTIDTSKAKLTPLQYTAIRTLGYNSCVKVGMQFRTAWWTSGIDKDGNPLKIVGGQTYTDKLLRTIIYPSYGDIQAGKTTTLIAGYCPSDDAQRLAALVAKEKDRAELTNVVLKDLAEIHNVTVEFLRDELIDTFAWSWSSDPYTMGSYARFGPGKFRSPYTSLTTPAADGLLHFAGEALSVRHGYVEGALHGAWRAVNEMLSLMSDGDKYLARFHEKWGRDPEWILEQ